MGLIELPSPANEPNRRLIYEGEGDDRKCFLVCDCGVRIPITAFRNYGGVIESRVRWNEHLAAAHEPTQ